MTGGAHAANGIVLMRPDGTAMSRNEVILRRRGAFHWLPALCSNDLVHGSWWFAWGSLLTAFSAVYPLAEKYEMHQASQDDALPSADYDITWALLIVSGAFFTLGSLAFVRAFEEPPQQALFYWYKHFQTDELLGAWFFLFGTMPAIPYTFVFFTIDPSAFYFFAFCAAIIFTLGSALFVVACYPSDKKRQNYILPIFLRINGAQMWAVKHLANDWLAGTWFFLWANALLTFGSFIMLLVALGVSSSGQTFIWLSGTICSFLFLVGSLYFVAGSYPHAQQFYYVTGRARADSTEDAYDEMGGLLNGAENGGDSNAPIAANKVTKIIYNQPLPPPVRKVGVEYLSLSQLATRNMRLQTGEIQGEKGDAKVDTDQMSVVSSLGMKSRTNSIAHAMDVYSSLPPVGANINNANASTQNVAGGIAITSPLHPIEEEHTATGLDLSAMEGPEITTTTEESRKVPHTADLSLSDQVQRKLATLDTNQEDDEEEEEEEEDIISATIHALHKHPSRSNSLVGKSNYVMISTEGEKAEGNVVTLSKSLDDADDALL